MAVSRGGVAFWVGCVCSYSRKQRVQKLSWSLSKLPNFFMTNHDYTMYSNDVEFINGIINVKISGRMLYQLTLSLWRLLCLCYYAEARLDVLKLTKHMEDGTIKARWRIKGLPFYSLLLRFYRKDKSHLYRTYDALSTFYIGKDGLIHCHKVEKVMPAQPPVLPRVTSFLTGALVALGVQEHRPALNLLPLLLSSLRQSRS
uniref:Si:ch211-215a10.4 n=1 Tax=Amphiprion percula TaxID=161767 RepID=A0A3P8SHN7_AMPPE